MPHRPLSTALAAALLACLSPAHAADAGRSASPDAPTEDDMLAPVIVTALAPASALSFTTDPKLPRQPVPASDGADYLKTVPGFGAVRNGGTNGDPVLRGMFGSRINILTGDGAMAGACPARMDNPLSYVAPETYDLLHVIKGPQSVRWGPGASAGTVRFERRTPAFETPGARLSASALGGSWHRNDQVADATLGAPAGYVRAVANRSEQDDYEDGDGRTVPSRWKKWNADVEAGWTPDADTRLAATFGRGDGEARYGGRGMDGTQFKRDSADLRFERGGFSGPLARVEASVYYNRADHVMDNFRLRDPDPMGPMPMPMEARLDRRTGGGRAAATWQLGAWEWVTGLDQQTSRHRNREAIDMMGMGGPARWVPDARFENLGAFAEGTWRIAADSRLITGARADRARAKDLRASTGGMMPMPNPTADQTRRETLGAGFVRYERDLAAAPATLYAGIGRSERLGDYWELISPDAGPAAAVNAFAGVKPETTTQLDVGGELRGRSVDAWVSLYAARIEDYILLRYGDGGMMGQRSQALNVDARTRGGEAGLRWRVAPGWRIEASAAYAWGENRDEHRPLAQMPPLEGRLDIGYVREAWSVGALWRVVARQNRVAVDEGNVVGRDLGPSAGFGTLALNAGYRFAPSLRLSGGIDNLFDRSYAEHLNLAGDAGFGYPADPVRIREPGRMVWVKLAVDY
ncbi:MAG TPA: TonB-dependent copper receptor [Dokdonella sp.]|uniref:TonB-dependent copper receptor n=1 Tax=Dokdonella sp. TaxID=2291710 RepID=UPI002C95E37D|nr:TonB-dependent copper receptor [Dokdonella sp.]HUD40828.1 TonB-dependent copper receptor [Dokdonella sp.]